MIDISKIERLMLLMAKHGFDVVQAESSGEKISLARNAAHASLFQNQTHSVQPHYSTANLHSPQNSANHSHYVVSEDISAETKESTLHNESHLAAPEAKKIPEGVTITSPFVGTFYRSPGPDANPFVEVGSKIKKGQALCIVEAMKLMNEIESEIDGEIVAILAENAKPVEFGTPLFIVAPNK